MERLIKDGYLVLDNILSMTECAEYKQFIDELFAINPDLDGLEIEGYNRLRVKIPGLNNKIHERLQRELNVKLHKINTLNVFSNWFPTKYVSGGNLGIHIDGQSNDGDIYSTHTILIYLNGPDNGDFTGGCTVFVDDYDSPMIVNELQPDNYIIPSPGRVLLLAQDKLHFAEHVTCGNKYIIRGDLAIITS
jgi:hypothetical protein